MPYDRKTLSFKGMGTVSLLKLAGRIRVGFCILGYQPAPSEPPLDTIIFS